MKLEWLEIRKFRHVQPGTRFRFAEGVNVVLGQNGTGKTTLLKLLSVITRWEFGAIEDEAFDLSFGFSQGVWRGQVMVRNTLSGPGGVNDWKVEFVLEDAAGQQVLLMDLTAQLSTFSLGEEVMLMRSPPSLGAIAECLRLIGPSSEWIDLMEEMMLRAGKGRLDEGTGVFVSLIEGDRYDNFAPHGFQTRVLWVGDRLKSTMLALPKDNPIPGFENLTPQDRTVEMIHGRLADFVPALAHLPSLMGFMDIQVQLRRKERKAQGDMLTDLYTGITFQAHLRDGSIFDQDKFSFGQKRLLTFLWYAAANQHGPILADELANGLHHSWIEACMQAIGEKQAILSTQNPLILDFVEFASVDQVASSLIRCEAHEDERGSIRWVWRNLSQEEAERFYRAYQANFQHVSEILKVEGLW